MRADRYDDFNPDDYAEQGYFNEFTGVFYPARKAGDRYTGRPLTVYMFGYARAGDILEVMGRARVALLSAERSNDWKAAGLRAEYDHFRCIAMRKSFARWCAQRRVADRCAEIERSVAELRNRIARIAA